MTPETITIKSDYGDEITYVIHPHGAAEGFDLAPKILSLLSAPANILAVLTSSVSTGDAKAALADTNASPDAVVNALAAEAEGLLGGVDGERLSGAIKDFGASILSAGGHKMCLQILKYTSATTPEGTSMKVGTDAGFNQRYVANYGELFFALYHAVRVNFGPMIKRLMEGKDPLAALGAAAKRTRK
jgi:hypothetical protein